MLTKSGAFFGAGWCSVAMAIGLAKPCSHPFWFWGYFLFGDIESCSPEVSSFLTGLVVSLSKTIYLFSFLSILL